ncbi:MAG: hypothetical protein WBZ36_21025 [Candidatus Nitrosopolaris sp.]|jgi:hypothetical protein
MLFTPKNNKSAVRLDLIVTPRLQYTINKVVASTYVRIIGNSVGISRLLELRLD